MKGCVVGRATRALLSFWLRGFPLRREELEIVDPKATYRIIKAGITTVKITAARSGIM